MKWNMIGIYLVILIGVAGLISLGVAYTPNSWINSISAISNFAVAILTSLYLIFTYQLLKESLISGKRTEEYWNTQMRLSVLPCMGINIELINEEIVFSLRNMGKIQALDVEIDILSCYSEEDMKIIEFLKQYQKKENSNFELNSNNEGFYSVRSKMIYYIFPPNKEVRGNLNIFKNIPYYHVLLQFRDIHGNNYCQYYEYCKENGKMILNGLKPRNI